MGEGPAAGTPEDAGPVGDPAERAGGPAEVDARIRGIGAELALSGPDDPDALAWWVEYGRLRWLRYNRRCYVEGGPPDPAELDAVIDAFTRSLDGPLDGVGAEAQAWLAGLLGDALRERYRLHPTGAADLHRAVELAARALDQLAMGSPDWFDRGESLADLYLDRFDLTGDGTDLDRAVGLFRQLVEVPGRTVTQAGHAWEQLGHSYATRHGHAPHPADRDRAIAALDTASRAGRCSPTAAALQAELLAERAEATGRDEDSAAAIAAVRAARTALDEDGPDESRAHLDRIGFMAHLNRYRARARGGDPDDLLVAAWHASALLANAAADPEARDAALLVRAMVRIEHARRTGDLAADLEASVADLAEVSPRADPGLRPLADSLLALGLLERARQEPRTGAIDRAVRCAGEVLERMTAHDGLRAELTDAFAFALMDQVSLGQITPATLDRAIDLLDRAVAGAPPGPAVAAALAGLGGAMVHRATVHGDDSAPDIAVGHLTTASSLVPAADPRRIPALVGLADVWTHRYAVRGDPSDLRRGLALLREAWAGDQRGRRSRYAVGVRLGRALLAGQVAAGGHDIDEAVTVLQECLPALHAEDAFHTRVFGVLGLCFSWRARSTGSTPDWRQAARYARRAATASLSMARRCLAAGDRVAAIACLEAGTGLVPHAASATATVPDLLRAAGRPELADEWGGAAGENVVVERTGPDDRRMYQPTLPSDLRHRAASVLCGDPKRLMPPTPADLAGALRTLDRDAVVYLFAGKPGEPGLGLIVSAAGAVDELALPELADPGPAAMTGRHPAELGEWAWRAAIGPVLSRFPRPRPRLVVVPSGALAPVPWHAARCTPEPRRAQPEPGFGGGEHGPSSPRRAQPEPGFGGGEHGPSSPGGAIPSAVDEATVSVIASGRLLVEAARRSAPA